MSDKKSQYYVHFGIQVEGKLLVEASSPEDALRRYNRYPDDALQDHGDQTDIAVTKIEHRQTGNIYSQDGTQLVTRAVGYLAQEFGYCQRAEARDNLYGWSVLLRREHGGTMVFTNIPDKALAVEVEWTMTHQDLIQSSTIIEPPDTPDRTRIVFKKDMPIRMWDWQEMSREERANANGKLRFQMILEQTPSLMMRRVAIKMDRDHNWNGWFKVYALVDGEISDVSWDFGYALHLVHRAVPTGSGGAYMDAAGLYVEAISELYEFMHMFQYAFPLWRGKINLGT